MNPHLSPASIHPDPYSASFAEGLGASLLASGQLDRASLDRALRAASTSGERFDAVLSKLGLVSEADLAAAVAAYLSLSLFTPTDDRFDRILPEKLTKEFVVHNRVVPIRIDATRITLAAVDPFDRLPIESVRFVADRAVQCEMIALSDFERLIERIYGGSTAPDPGRSTISADVEPNEYDLQRLRDSASEAPVVRLVNDLIAKAVDARASDIHIEPSANALLVRYRIDGLLRTVEEIPARLRSAVVSRVKILAKLDIAERRLPQDGRIKLAFRGNEIDFRTATIPTMNGESIVMRVLDRNRVRLDFQHLGFSDSQIGTLNRLMENSNGIILVTGPTGSGKTTTLYTMLRHLNRAATKIFTVEDPIEYQLAGINQVQVQQSIGLDFPSCLRAILRQDPDMIMIGEIRDAETARIAVQSSLTGHLVFSTLHTNSAAETVTRLIDMGIEHFLLGSTVRGIMAQRLVRRLCPHCAKPHARSAYWVEYIRERVPSLGKASAPNLLEPGACEKCQHSGFHGRLSIAEIMTIDDPLQQAILRRSPASELLQLARRSGMISMYEDGIAKSWQGLTTVEEVLRVTDAS